MLGILLDHAIGRKDRAEALQGCFHKGYPAAGDVVRPALIVKRHDFLFEQIVEGPALNLVLVLDIFVDFAFPDGPAVVALVSFAPPPVENTHVEAAVESHLHAAGAAGLHGAERGVEPDIDPLHQMPGNLHVVIFNKNNSVAEALLVRGLHQLADQLLPLLVLGVGLAGEQDLYRHLRVIENPGKPVKVAQQQSAAFVGGKTPGETDGQHLGVEHLLGGGDFLGGGADLNQLGLKPLAGKINQLLTGILLNPP